MKPNVLLVVRKDNEQVIAVYAGVDSNQHIYGKLLLVESSTWPIYIRVQRSLTEAVLDENGKGTGVRKWFVDDIKPPKFYKKFKEMKAKNEGDEDFIDIVNQTLEDKEFCQIYRTFLKDSH